MRGDWDMSSTGKVVPGRFVAPFWFDCHHSQPKPAASRTAIHNIILAEVFIAPTTIRSTTNATMAITIHGNTTAMFIFCTFRVELDVKK